MILPLARAGTCHTLGWMCSSPIFWSPVSRHHILTCHQDLGLALLRGMRRCGADADDGCCHRALEHCQDSPVAASATSLHSSRQAAMIRRSRMSFWASPPCLRASMQRYVDIFSNPFCQISPRYTCNRSKERMMLSPLFSLISANAFSLDKLDCSIG